MSRPTRIAVSLMISLILVAAVLISVQGAAALHAGRVYERLDLTVGLTSDQSHVRTPQLVNYQAAPEQQDQHHCDHNAAYNNADN